MSNFETLNSGEWSELYAALKILASRTLHGANLLETIPNESCLYLEDGIQKVKLNSQIRLK